MVRGLLRFAALAIGVAALVAAGRSGAIEAALASIEGLGALALPAFVLLHAVSVAAFVPSLAPNLAAGAIFGLTVGLPASLVGAALGALLAFSLGRTLARGVVEARFGGDVRFRALAQLARTRGWRIVALARLSPLFPFAIGNYCFGLSPIPARHYVLASLLGTIPSNAVYVYLGSVAGDLAQDGVRRGRSAGEWALLVVGGMATVALALYLRRVAVQELNEARGLPSADAGNDPESLGKGLSSRRPGSTRERR